MDYKTPPAIDVQTNEWRVDQFVRAICPNASEDAIAAAKADVYHRFNMQASKLNRPRKADAS